MRIEIYGPGCAKCQNTEEIVRKAIADLGQTAEVIKIAEIEAMLDRGILKTPAVYVDGRKMIEGRVPTEAEVQQWLAG